MDVTPEEVTRVLAESGLTRMIHGHTHRPAVHDVAMPDGSDATRIVLGDWDATGWALDVVDGTPTLGSFAIT